MTDTAKANASTAAARKEQAAAADSTPAPTNRVRSAYSRPVFVQELTLHSLQAQRVVDRSLGRVSYSLYSLDVILQIIGKREQIDEVEEVVQSMISNAVTTLDNGIAQLQARLKENGHSVLPTYTNPKVHQVEISSPQVAEFSRLIVKLDTVISLLDTLWLHGLVANRERTYLAQDWQQFLNKLASRIIGVEKHARIAAHNEGKGAEVNEAAPVSDEHELDREAEADEATAADTKVQPAGAEPATSDKAAKGTAAGAKEDKPEPKAAVTAQSTAPEKEEKSSVV